MSARSLLRLRARGLRRQIVSHPARSLGGLLLVLLGLLGVSWNLLDLYAEISARVPAPDALAVAPPGSSPAYATWREVSFWGMLLLWMPACYRSMRDLFHRPEWSAYAALPLQARDVYLEAVWLVFGFCAFWLPVALLFALPPWLAGDSRGALSVALYALACFVSLVLAAPGVHAAAARAATLPNAGQVLGPLASGWVNAEAAPFLYAPAAVFAGMGLGGIALQRGVESLVYLGPGAGAPGLLVTLGVSALLFVAGRSWYGASLFRVLPVLREAERALNGGEALAREVPYGEFVAPLLPQQARPWLGLSLRAISRGGRARWLQLVLLLLAGALFLWRTQTLPGWFSLAAAAAGAWVGSIGVWLSEEHASPRWLCQTLPARGLGVVLGRSAASAFFAAHLGAGLGLALWWWGAEGSLWIGLAAPAAGWLAGLLPEIPGLRRAPLWAYALFCGASLAVGRASISLVVLCLAGLSLLLLPFASLRATAPYQARS